MMLALIMAILSTLFIASRGICGRNLLRKINIVKQYSNHHLQSLLTIIPQFPRLYMSTQGGEISPTPPAAVAPLKAKLNEDMKESMKAKQKERLGAIRAVTTAIKQKEVDDRITLTDDDIITIMTKLLKQRKESIISYQAAGRQDLVDIVSSMHL